MVKDVKSDIRKVVSELEKKSFGEIKREIELTLDSIERNIHTLIRQKRVILHGKADQMYILMSTLLERCSQLPRSFGAGFWEHIWKLGFKCPKKQLCRLIRNVIKNPKFNYVEFEKALNKLICKTNIIGDMLEKAERKYIQYTGRRQPGWPIMGRTFRDSIVEELEFYDMKDMLRPCQLLTNQWLALARQGECKKKVDGVI